MTILTISDAARLAEVSRQTIYERIESGSLSRTPDGIDVAELARVYPNLKPLEHLQIKSVKKHTKKKDNDDQVPAEMLENRDREVAYLKGLIAKQDEQLAAKDVELKKQSERLYEKDQFWQKHLDEARNDFQRLLEAPAPRKKFLGIF